MKVLILTPNYPRKNALMNGIFIHQQVKALQELGAECHVLLLHNWYPKFQLHKFHPTWQQGYELRKTFFDEFEGVKVYHVPVVMRMPDRIFKNDYYQRAADALVKYIKRNKSLKGADWLYAHFLTDCGYIAALAKQRLNIKLAAIARGDDVHAWPEADNKLVKHLEYVFDKADMLLANSQRLAKDAKKWMKNGSTREMETVYNGIDHSKFQPVKDRNEKENLLLKFDLSPSYKYIVCVATPVKLKGWLELLQSIKALGDKFAGWKLVIVGSNRNEPDAIDLVSVSEDLGISDKVLFKGQVAPGDMVNLYKAVDAFVLPSYNEGMANALLEAMSTGLACIATDVGGHSEVIENGKDGLLVAPKSIRELELALERICTDNEILSSFGINSRKRMLALGNYKENAQKLYSLLASFKNDGKKTRYLSG